MGRKRSLQRSSTKATVKKNTVSRGRSGSSRPVKPAREPRLQRATRSSARSFVPSFPVVGIGASAGGLEAFTHLLEHLPLDTGMAFVLVQHLDPDHESALAQILARVTSMPVREVANELRIEPNHVYIIPPNTDMAT